MSANIVEDAIGYTRRGGSEPMMSTFRQALEKLQGDLEKATTRAVVAERKLHTAEAIVGDFAAERGAGHRAAIAVLDRLPLVRELFRNIPLVVLLKTLEAEYATVDKTPEDPEFLVVTWAWRGEPLKVKAPVVADDFGGTTMGRRQAREDLAQTIITWLLGEPVERDTEGST